jgi:ADP-heptose:LPS heptosyltransferase
VLASAVFPPLKNACGGGGITVVCLEEARELYQSCAAVDEVITVNRPLFGQDQLYVRHILSEIGRRRADAAVNAMVVRDKFSDLLALASCAPHRIALQRPAGGIPDLDADGRDRLFTALVQAPAPEEHEFVHLRALLGGMGIAARELLPRLTPAERDEQCAAEWFAESGLEAAKTVALLLGKPSHLPAFNEYSTVLNDFCLPRGFSVIILGSDQDSEPRQRLLSQLKVPLFDLCGQVGFMQGAALLGRCRLAVGNEIEFASAAGALRIPHVVVLGGGYFGRYLPFSPFTTAACLPLKCCRCRWLCRYREPYCMSRIPPQVVHQALVHALSAEHDRPAVFVPGRAAGGDSGMPDAARAEELLNPAAYRIVQVP